MSVRPSLLITGILLLISLIGRCQMAMPGGMSRQNMDIGHFYGKVMDVANSRPIEGASVQLIQNKYDSVTRGKKDVVIALKLSNKKGEFSLEKIPVMGSYQLKISAVGFKNHTRKLSFDLNMQAARNGDFSSLLNGVDKDLGNIKLDIDEQQLQNLTLTASKSIIQLNLDKKVYNVEKDLMSTGGSALDVMKNIPSVTVDMDGNVSLRNAPPQIFIDGRPTTLSPDQIPADQIASVEIITNPSAKYDASGGGAGILNIVLKKNRKTGYNGNIRASIDSRGRPGGGGDFNLRQNKVNFFASGMLGFRKSISTISSNRQEYNNNLTILQEQHNRPVGTGYFAFIRSGLDYFIDNRSTLTLSGNIGRGHFQNNDQILLNRDTLNGSVLDKSTGIRNLMSIPDFRNYGSSLGFKHNFSQTGRELTADINYNFSRSSNNSTYNGQFFDAINNPLGPVLYERSYGEGRTHFLTIQTDYSTPLPHNQKIEAGLRIAKRKYKSFNENQLGFQADNLIAIPELYVDYRFNDDVYAGYLTYSKQWKKVSLQLGGRIESSKYAGDLLSKNQSFSNEFPFSFFPSAYTTFSLSKKEDLQLNYSRKINRPGFFQLIPFIDFSDSLNLSIGNPNLVPEFTHLVEMTYSNQVASGQTFLATAYGRLTNNLITRYQYRDKNPNPAKTDSVVFTTYANATRSFTYGLELTSKNKISKRWDITVNLNFFHITLEADNLTGTGNSNLYSFFGKMNNSFKLPKNFSIQLNGEYQARTLLPQSSGGNRGMMGGGPFGQAPVTAQGYIKPFYGIDIALKKDFLKNNAASLTLQFSDIFRSRYNSTVASSVFFNQEYERIRDPQIARLSFNWRFGKLDANLFKRKNIKGEMENMQNMQQGVNQ